MAKPKRLWKATQTTSAAHPKTETLFLSYELPFNTGNIIFDQSGKFDMLKKKTNEKCPARVLCVSFLLSGVGVGSLRGFPKAGQRYVARSGDI